MGISQLVRLLWSQYTKSPVFAGLFTHKKVSDFSQKSMLLKSKFLRFEPREDRNSCWPTLHFCPMPYFQAFPPPKTRPIFCRAKLWPNETASCKYLKAAGFTVHQKGESWTKKWGLDTSDIMRNFRCHMVLNGKTPTTHEGFMTSQKEVWKISRIDCISTSQIVVPTPAHWGCTNGSSPRK